MFWLSLLIWLALSQTCELQASRECDSVTAGTVLSTADATPEACAQACLDSGVAGCCEFDGSTCTVYEDSNSISVTAVGSVFAAFCVSFGPSKAPYQCIDDDDFIFTSGIPFAFTCEDATYWIAVELGFSDDMCDLVSNQWLQGRTYREVCCAECASLDSVWVDDDSYQILTGLCIDSELGATTSFVEDRFRAFRECAQLCSETQSCQGFTYNSARPVSCKIHIRSEFHQSFINDGWSSTIVNDGDFVDSSDNSPLNGDCMLRITQAPSTAPSVDPTVRPSDNPSVIPTDCPSVDPTTNPSFSPSVIPSNSPSCSPSVDPSHSPSLSPSSSRPTVIPTTSPSTGPSVDPTVGPSKSPTLFPTSDSPSVSPTYNPTKFPTTDSPSTSPTVSPSTGPSVDPTFSPSLSPSISKPTISPTKFPTTDQPSVSPSHNPSVNPTFGPSFGPSVDPSTSPSTSPSVGPTLFPTSDEPSVSPSDDPTTSPTTDSPSVMPTNNPSLSPSSEEPSTSPTTDTPSVTPTKNPTFTQPTNSPSLSPTTCYPSTKPTVAPSYGPSTDPTTDTPTIIPTDAPSTTPSKFPTGPPSTFPSTAPTGQPRVEPTSGPSTTPTTDEPSVAPTKNPTFEEPSYSPTVRPSCAPSTGPTVDPTKNPTFSGPSTNPSVDPTFAPSVSPTTDEPSISPTFNPSFDPSVRPSYNPSVDPTVPPSTGPTVDPTLSPSVDPSVAPSFDPSVIPSDCPSVDPTTNPSFGPSVDPTNAPSTSPTVQPSFNPSYTPTITNPCSPADMNILGSDFIFLNDKYSSFENDNLKLAVSFPGRYKPMEAEFSDAKSDVAAFNGDFSDSQFWSEPELEVDEECLYVMKFEMTWAQVLKDEAMGLDLHYGGNHVPDARRRLHPETDEQYFLNTLKMTFNENATSYFFEIDITREIHVEIPWLILLKDQIELTFNMTISIPTFGPTTSPSTNPSSGPSLSPTSDSPSVSPTKFPTTDQPTNSPTVSPSVGPSVDPTKSPSFDDPTLSPSLSPTTESPSTSPSVAPSDNPTVIPTHNPSTSPTSESPSTSPTISTPTISPTNAPSTDPTVMPSDRPSVDPTTRPSHNPSVCPTFGPSVGPSTSPSFDPSVSPTVQPSNNPSVDPTVSPSVNPTVQPSDNPTLSPTSDSPTVGPTQNPTTDQPSRTPSVAPTTGPTVIPTNLPSVDPTVNPSYSPSVDPSRSPTPRQEIDFDVDVEAWETFSLGNYIDAADHVGEVMEVMEVPAQGSFNFGGSVVTAGQTLQPTDLASVGFTPEVVTTNTTVTFVIQGDHERYNFNIKLVRPSPCVGAWSEWSTCSTTCDEGTQDRLFTVSSPADPFGDPCIAEDGDTETQTCEVIECPVLDKIILEFAVAEPTLTGTTKVKFNFTTLVQWPWKTLAPEDSNDPDCWDIADDNTALSSKIVDDSESFYIIEDCSPDYIYGRFPGFCVGVNNNAALVPAIYIRGADDICPDPNDLEDCKVHPICEEICTQLDACEGFDIFYDRPDPSRWVCEVLGQNITSVEQNWVESNYDVLPWFFFRFDIFTPESPVGGNIPPATDVDCYLRDTPVYEGDCQQKWHGEYDVTGVCNVNGEYTTTICVQHQVTGTIDKVPVTLQSSLDTSCATVVDTLSLEGTIETFADSDYSFSSTIYHVGDVVYAQSEVTSRTELTGLSLVGLVADQGFDPPDLFPSVISQSIESLAVLDDTTNNYKTTIQFSFTLDNVDGSGDGLATVLAATFEAEYVGGSRRILALDTNTHAPVGASETLMIYPAPCADPVAAYGQYLTETCGEDIRILKCDEDGLWTTILDEWPQGTVVCPSSSGVYISQEAPEGVDSQSDTRTIYVNNESNDDSLILTGIIVAVVAFLVALAVYLYVEYYGNCFKDDRKTIVSFDSRLEGEPSKVTTPTADFAPTPRFFEPEFRQTTAYNDNLNYQDQDDNVSEISVSSTLKEDQAMHMVFEQVFEEGHNAL